MGVCNSTQDNTNRNKSVTAAVDKGSDLDFESYRENFRKTENTAESKIYDVKAKLWEISIIDKKIKKKLISKYLFFRPNGKVISKVLRKSTGDEILIDGFLNVSGEISLSVQEKNKQDKIYEGKLDVSQSSITCNGQIKEYDLVKKEKVTIDTTTSFLLDFSNVQWEVEYTSNNKIMKTNVFLYYKNDIFSGFSYDGNGYAIWTGLEKSNNAVTLIQHYIDNDYKNNSEKGILSYNGVFDKISFIIDGDLYSHSITDKVYFTMKKIGKLFKKNVGN